MKKSIKILFIAGVFSLAGALSLNAWTGPTEGPPGGNLSAPLNVSGSSQTKTGNLYFPKWFDSDNSGYYIDPSGTSNIHYLKYLQLAAQDGTNEGGELSLLGSGSYPGVHIDNYQGNARIHTLASGKIFQVIGGEGIQVNGIKLGSEDTIYSWAEAGSGTSGGGDDTLQSVTDNGDTTTNNIYSSEGYIGAHDYMFAPIFYDAYYNGGASYYVDPASTSRLNGAEFTGYVKLGGIWRNTWPEGLNDSTGRSCINSYCTGTNSVIFPVENSNGESMAWPAVCYGDWWVDVRSSNWDSACSTGWLRSYHNCNNPSNYPSSGAFSNCPDPSGDDY